MKLKYIGLGAAAVLLAVECAFIPAEASAITGTPRGGPQEAPGGTYFLQGQLVSFCFRHAPQGGGWLEWNTTIPGGLGNCPAGDTQLTVWADPQGIEPAAPTTSPSP